MGNTIIKTIAYYFVSKCFQVSGLPVVTLLGGCQQDSILLYRAISQGTPDEMAALVSKYKKQVRIQSKELLI